MQVKMAHTIAVTAVATQIPITMYIGFRDSFRVKMRRYCSRIEILVKNKERW